MNNMKKISLALFGFLSVQCLSSGALAQGVAPDVAITADPVNNPITMSDSIRGAVGNILSLKDFGKHPEIGCEINVTQGEADAVIEGDTSYVVDEGTGAASNQDLNLSSYDYIKEKVLDNDAKTPYSPLNGKITSGASMEQVVKEMFFIDNEADDTQEKREEKIANRNAYLKAVAQNYTRLAYGVQEKLIDDMDAISADINGNGSIGAVAGLDQTWKSINKALIADIAMQIQLMELDAAKFLSVQPVVVMPENKPAASTSGEDNKEGGSNS